MPKADDPYYNRKPIPDSLIQDVGLTGLSAQDEHHTRERKYSRDGGDIRKFSRGQKSSLEPESDPYYGRKQVNKADLDGVADSGLSAEEEYQNRERKYSTTGGGDIRKFSRGQKGSFEPQSDPYYGRKQVSSNLTQGIGETGNTPAQDFEIRERKQSVVNFSGDPFQLLSGQGHRQSVSGGGALAAANAATERRRSSAVGPGAAAAAANATQHHSGYDGGKLTSIQSKPELPPVANVSDDRDAITSSSTSGSATGPTGPIGGSAAPGANGHTVYHDSTTVGHSHGGIGHTHGAPEHNHTPAAPAQQTFEDPDSVAPDERR